jgi:hypothetical protein
MTIKDINEIFISFPNINSLAASGQNSPDERFSTAPALPD